MAERTMTLTVADVRALGDRLFARGQSRLTDDHHFKADLRTAARVIWRLATDYAATETIQIPAEG
jgi:hypothetical protein